MKIFSACRPVGATSAVLQEATLKLTRRRRIAKIGDSAPRCGEHQHPQNRGDHLPLKGESEGCGNKSREHENKREDQEKNSQSPSAYAHATSGW